MTTSDASSGSFDESGFSVVTLTVRVPSLNTTFRVEVNDSVVVEYVPGDAESVRVETVVDVVDVDDENDVSAEKSAAVAESTTGARDEDLSLLITIPWASVGRVR